MKSSFNEKSGNTYWVSPKQLVDQGVQVNKMSRDNCYKFCPDRGELPLELRQKHYDELSLLVAKKGFSEIDPILIMLNRTHHGEDKIIDGHHRLSIALDLDLELVPVRFVY